MHQKRSPITVPQNPTKTPSNHWLESAASLIDTNTYLPDKLTAKQLVAERRHPYAAYAVYAWDVGVGTRRGTIIKV